SDTNRAQRSLLQFSTQAIRFPDDLGKLVLQKLDARVDREDLRPGLVGEGANHVGERGNVEGPGLPAAGPRGDDRGAQVLRPQLTEDVSRRENLESGEAAFVVVGFKQMLQGCDLKRRETVRFTEVVKDISRSHVPAWKAATACDQPVIEDEIRRRGPGAGDEMRWEELPQTREE